MQPTRVVFFLRALAFVASLGLADCTPASAPVGLPTGDPDASLPALEQALACTRAHWGKPWEVLVATCWQNDAQAAADAIADLELLFEQEATATGGGAAAAALTGASPYAQVPALSLAVAQKRHVPKAH